MTQAMFRSLSNIWAREIGLTKTPSTTPKRDVSLHARDVVLKSPKRKRASGDCIQASVTAQNANTAHPEESELISSSVKCEIAQTPDQLFGSSDPVDEPLAPLPIEVPELRKPKSSIGNWWSRLFDGDDKSWCTSLVQAVYSGAFDGEGGIEDVGFTVSWWTQVKGYFFGDHGSRHRSIRRVAKLVFLLRPLLDELRCRLPPADLCNVEELGLRFTERAVKSLLDEIETGKTARLSHIRFEPRQRATLQRLMCALAPLLTDEDMLVKRIAVIVGSQSVRC